MSRKTPISSPFRETIFTIQNQSRELNDIPIYNPDYSVLSTNAQPSYQYPRPVAPPPMSRPTNTTPKKSIHTIPVSHTPTKQQPILPKEQDHRQISTPKKQPQLAQKQFEYSQTPRTSTVPVPSTPTPRMHLQPQPTPRQSFASTPQQKTKPMTPKQQQQIPTPKPVKSPTSQPFKSPTPKPVKPATPNPVKSPTPKPVKSSTPKANKIVTTSFSTVSTHDTQNEEQKHPQAGKQQTQATFPVTTSLPLEEIKGQLVLEESPEQIDEQSQQTLPDEVDDLVEDVELEHIDSSQALVEKEEEKEEADIEVSNQEQDDDVADQAVAEQENLDLGGSIEQPCQETLNSEVEQSEEVDAAIVAGLVVQAAIYNALEQSDVSEEIVKPQVEAVLIADSFVEQSQEEDVVVDDAAVVEEPSQEEDVVVDDAAVVEEPSQEEDVVVDDAAVVEEPSQEEDVVADDAAVAEEPSQEDNVEEPSQETNLDATFVAGIVVQAAVHNALTQADQQEIQIEQEELESEIESEAEQAHQSEIEFEVEQEAILEQEAEQEEPEDVDEQDFFEEQDSFEGDEFSPLGEDGEGEIVYEYIYEGEEGEELLEVQPE